METIMIIAFSILIGLLLLAVCEISKLKKELDNANSWIDMVTCNSKYIENVNIYQKRAQDTNKYKEGFEKRVCCSLGLASEAGEVAGKVDKCIRKNHNTDFTDEQKRDIALEIGDVLWFAAGLAYDLGYSLSEICSMNLEKLSSRDKRNVICGSGDHR